MPDKPGTGTETPPKENPGNLPEAVTQVLEDIKKKLDGVPTTPTPEQPRTHTGPTASELREDMKKRLGFNEDQMRAHEEMLLTNQAPIIQQLGWNHLDKKKDIETYRKEIEEELKLYPPHQQTPAILEKIYYFVKGKHADSKPADPPKPAAGGGAPGTRVVSGPGYSGNDPGVGGGAGARGGEGGEDKPLNDLEKFVASKLGVSEKDYAKARDVGKTIRELRSPDARPVNSLADVELRRMRGA